MVLIDSYDFSTISTLIDVGDGHGEFVKAFLERYPSSRAVLFDRTDRVEIGRKILADAALLARCEIVGGDESEGLPSGGDAYLLTEVVSQSDDERAVAVLRNCRRAMNPMGRVLLIEQANSPDGRGRAAHEYQAVLVRAGFGLARIIALASGSSVIEAYPYA
jgi:hypothetical protein